MTAVEQHYGDSDPEGKSADELDRIAEAIAEAHELFGRNFYAMAAAARFAINSARTPVAVKPLEWVEGGDYGHLFAGPYEISFSGNKCRIGLHYHYVKEGYQDDDRLFSGANTEGAAERLKALAETHNERRILSALIGGEA